MTESYRADSTDAELAAVERNLAASQASWMGRGRALVVIFGLSMLAVFGLLMAGVIQVPMVFVMAATIIFAAAAAAAWILFARASVAREQVTAELVRRGAAPVLTPGALAPGAPGTMRQLFGPAIAGGLGLVGILAGVMWVLLDTHGTSLAPFIPIWVGIVLEAIAMVWMVIVLVRVVAKARSDSASA